MRGDPWSYGLAGVSVLLAIATLGLWIPLDVEAGIIETFRRQTTVGDAMGPTVAAVGVLIAAFGLALTTFIRSEEPKTKPFDRLSLLFIGRIALVITLSLVVMFHTGPVIVDVINMLGGEIGSYRQLRDTMPYKYLGYLAGGALMIGGIIAVIEQRVATSALTTTVIATIALTIFYDVPFDYLLLPPNGDQ